LLALLHAQLAEFGGVVTKGTVTHLRRTPEGNFSAEYAECTVEARTVLVATGVVDVEPVIPGYEQVKDSGLVRFCPVCDGYEFTDERVGVIGSGAHGRREYDFIRGFSERVSYVALDAGPKPVRISCDHGSIGIELADGSSKRFDVVYCALGSKPRSTLAFDLGASHDDHQCCIVNAHQAMSIEGLFAAGDVVSGLDQLAVAAGQAAIAATEIHNRLRSR
jgi:thioredoxin reductase (NADPH)